MKKLLSVVLAVAMVVSLATTAVWAAVTPTAGWLESFTGDTLTIGSAEDLAAFNAADTDYAGKNVVLTADITFDGDWTPKNFAGTFDGAGYSISGLKASMFNTLSGTVQNLYLLDSNVTAAGGILAVRGSGALVDGVYINGTVAAAAHNLAGFLGDLGGNGATIKNSWFDGTVAVGGTYYYCGGFVGNQQSKALVIENCLNTGSVSDGSGHACGFSNAVYNGTLTITNSLNLGQITNNANGDAPTMGRAFTGTLRDNSVVVLTNCFNDPAKADDDNYNVRNNALLNGATNPKDYATEGDAYTAADIVATYDENTLAALGSAWAMGEEGYPVPAVFANASSTPTVEGDIIITTWDELVAWAANGSNDEGKVVALAADITASAGATWTPKDFAGTFNGYDYFISGLNNGFVNKLSGTIKNLSLINSAITAEGGSKGILVNDASGLISGVYVSGTITATANNIGGIAGHQFGALTIENTWFDGTVTSTNTYVGGFVANQESNALVLTNCVNTGTITAPGNVGAMSDSVYAGSLTATNCVNFGTVYMGDGLGRAYAGTTGSGSTAGSAVLTKCYTLKNSTINDFFLRSGATINGMTVDQGTPSGSYVVFEGIPAVFTMNELADVLAELGSDWGVNAGDDGEYILVPVKFANATELPDSDENEDEKDENVIEIADADDLLAWMRDTDTNAGKTVVLTADITIPAGATIVKKAVFAGTFDGDYHYISGLKASSFISTLDGTLKNVAFIDGQFEGGVIWSVGNGAVVDSVYSSCDVTGRDNHAGGIVAMMHANDATIQNCWFDGSVTVTQRYAAGILANQDSHTGAVIKNCLNTGTITGGGNGTLNCCLAGISAAVYAGDCVAENCLNLGTITCTGDASLGVFETGGIIGKVTTGSYTVKNCFVLKDSCNYAECASANVGATDNAVVIESAAYEDTAAALGDEWGLYWVDYDNSFPVPAIFATARPLPADAIVIETWEDLVAWAADADKNEGKIVALIDDINAPLNATWTAKAEFAGTFLGQGHMISLPAGTDGLFKTLSGDVSDLALFAMLSGESNIGILAANVKANITISNTIIAGSVTITGNNGGAFVAEILPSNSGVVVNFENCANVANVTCNLRYASGFVGNNQSNTTNFYNCLNMGNVTVKGDNGEPIVAGFAGAIYGGSAEFVNCINIGKITSEKNADAESPGSCAFAYRVDSVDKLSLTNCLALAGTATKIANESLANPVEGQYNWLSATDDLTALASFAGEWILAEVDGELVPIPAVFTYMVDDYTEISATPATSAPATSSSAAATSSSAAATSSSAAATSSAAASSSAAATSSAAASSSAVASSSATASASASASGSIAPTSSVPQSTSHVTSDSSFTLLMIAAVILSAGAFAVVAKARSRA